MYEKEYLEHYGILGMKWGVRRTPEQLGHETAEKYREKQLTKVGKEINKAERVIQKADLNPSNYALKYKKEQAQKNKDYLLSQVEKINKKSTDDLLKERYEDIERKKAVAIQVGKRAVQGVLAAAVGITFGKIAGTMLAGAKLGADIVFNSGGVNLDFGDDTEAVQRFILSGNTGSITWQGQNVDVSRSGGSTVVTYSDGYSYTVPQDYFDAYRAYTGG